MLVKFFMMATIAVVGTSTNLKPGPYPRLLEYTPENLMNCRCELADGREVWFTQVNAKDYCIHLLEKFPGNYKKCELS